MINFSVLLSVYIKDNPEFLQQALESIRDQTVLPGELVIVEDGPVSELLENVIETFEQTADITVKRVKLKQNGGLGRALNEGLKHCSFEYVARMDSDDINKPDRFEKQLEFLTTHSDVTALGSYLEEFNAKPGDLNRIKKVPLTPEAIRQVIVKRNPMNHPTVMFRKKDIESCGSYESVLLFEDYYLWFKLNKMGFKMANTDNVLLNFRIGNDMVGRRHGWSYLLKELKFINKVREDKLIANMDALSMAILRLPFRILPKGALKVIYKFVLRR